MNDARRMLLALLAAGAITPHPRRERSPAELDELRKKCAAAELLELGHIAWFTTDRAGRQIVEDEINRRMEER